MTDHRTITAHITALMLTTLLLTLPLVVTAWPLDDADGTAIGRLEYMRRVEAEIIKGQKQPPGALLPSAAVDLRLLDQSDFELPPPDRGFTATVRALLGASASRYSLAILDLSDPTTPYYAEHRADELYNPGSVGKLLVGLAWMQALADRFPSDLDARWRLLRDTRIIADDVIISDSHTVRRWDHTSETLIRRPLEVGDPGTLFEYLDWMISPSSNASASLLIRQAMLLNHFGADYPVDNTAAAAFFDSTPAAARSALLEQTLQQPVVRNNFDLHSLRQGSLFTRTGKKLVSGTTSRASARGLMQFLLRLEQGRVVDAFSSRILKRLMYVTERRIRYASSPVLRDAAVYFKSGSWYRCEEEEGFKCRKYHGNVFNLMHSVAIVEAPAAERRLYYMVVLMSNVLRKNSAVDHQSLATAIHRLIAARNPPPAPVATASPDVQPAAAVTPAAPDTDEAAAPPKDPVDPVDRVDPVEPVE